MSRRAQEIRALRGLGLSQRKAATVLDLAQRFADGAKRPHLWMS